MKKPSITLRIRAILSLVILLAGTFTSTVQAYDVQFFQSNNILFYNPSDTSGCMDVGSSPTTKLNIPSLVGNSNAEKIWNFLTGQGGLTAEQAAGVMGNIAQESGYDPNLTEGNGIGYGIIQWSFERRTALESAAAQQGVPVSDLGFQLAYMVQEAESPPLTDFHNLFANFGVSSDDNVWDQMKKQTTVERATTFWHDGFERSGDYQAYGSIQHRIDYANQAYEQFTGKSASSGNGFNGSECTFAGGDLQATLLAYAWPQYHEGDYLEMKPAYKTAVDKALNDCHVTQGTVCVNVGGGIHPGIDCAGFVNLLITNSGFEKTFNNSGEGNGSGTGEQQERAWMMEHWKRLGLGGTINVADLRPGDVGVTHPESVGITEHVFIYVGQVNGFDGQFASASYGTYDGSGYWRAPMSAGTYENATSTDFEWYGKR